MAVEFFSCYHSVFPVEQVVDLVDTYIREQGTLATRGKSAEDLISDAGALELYTDFLTCGNCRDACLHGIAYVREQRGA